MNILCKNCFNCKLISNGKEVKCSLGYFTSIPIGKLSLLTPEDFDCTFYDNGD